MKKIRWIFYVLVLGSLTGCITAAQEAEQQAQMQRMVDTLTPEQRAALAMEILERQAGLTAPPRAPVVYYTPPVNVPPPPKPVYTYCQPDQANGVYCYSH